MTRPLTYQVRADLPAGGPTGPRGKIVLSDSHNLSGSPTFHGGSGLEARPLFEAAPELKSLLAEEALAPQTDDAEEMVACSPQMRLVMEEARRVAGRKVTVLIEGESGTGKELIARLIHRSSPRASKPFVRVNCAALSEGLVESELFGHERGAFTGAAENRVGRFELAHAGTILLDEISEVSVKVQAKLLRILEEEEFERVGGNRTMQLDLRVIATTNRDLERDTADGCFRPDLYYRLKVITLYLPPLRQRREEIAPLVHHFLARYAGEALVPVHGVSRAALTKLLEYDWPGNVRQLRNVIHRACIMTDHEELLPSDLPPLDKTIRQAPDETNGTLEAIERTVILRTLREFNGNKTAAAERLGVTPRTLLNKMNKYRADGAA